MPELPEVETIKKDLTRKIKNKKIVAVEVKKKNVIKEPSVARFRKGLIGKTVENIKRKAKVLIIEISGNNFLIIHLRIAGWLLYGEEEKNARVTIKFSDGSVLNYMDQRLLGELRLRRDYHNLDFIRRLGPEPFEIDELEFVKILKKRKANIKSLLLNQNIISGIGNIYAQEALFLAKINPTRKSNSISAAQAKNLHRKLIDVLTEAITHKGSSVDLYRVLDGQKGGMEERLKVYSRQGQECLVCGEKIKKIAISGRGTCFCPRCQR